MRAPPLRVLFLCTGNSARSQIGEAILRNLSSGTIEVFSAGSHPRPEIHPLARIAASRVLGLDMAGQHPKSMDEFRSQRFDYVITVCDRAAESCPVFPNDPVRIRWSLEDPGEVQGTDEEKSRAFERTARDLTARIRIWMASPAISRRIDVPPGERAK
jgi:protein-tyrosine-phosphatase